MKIENTVELKSQFGVAGASQLQVVGGPICNAVMSILIIF